MPAYQQCEPEVGGERKATSCATCANDTNFAWRTEVDRALAMLLIRVAGVDDSVGKISQGVARLLEELHGMARNARKEARAQSRSTTVRVQGEWVNAATSNPSDWQQCYSHSDAGDKMEAVKTPECPAEPAMTQPVATPCNESNQPILVDLDNLSNDSDDHRAADEGPGQTPDSRGNRVHCQPRQRVVPCTRKILAKKPSATDGEASTRSRPNPNMYTPMYKDPPGYGNVTDFGAGNEHRWKPPTLQPRTTGVREQQTPQLPVLQVIVVFCGTSTYHEKFVFVFCRHPCALARDVGFYILASICRLWARPRPASTTDRGVNKRSSCRDARTASSIYCSKTYIAMTRLSYFRTIRILGPTKCVIAWCGVQAVPGSGCAGGAVI